MKRRRKYIRRGLQIGVLSVIFFFLGRNLYYYRGELASYSWEPDLFYLAISFILSAACGLLVALGWNFILRSLGQRISHWRALRVYFLSELGRYIPGKIWSFLGRIYLAEEEKVPKILTTASIGVQIIIQLVSGMIVALLSLPFWSGLGIGRSYYYLFLVIPAGLVALQPAFFNRLLNFVLLKFKKVRLEVKLRYHHIILLLLYWIGMWVLKGGSAFFLLRAIYRGPLPPFSFQVMVGLIALAWTVATLSFIAPAGLGVLEGVMYAFLKTLLHLAPGIATVFVLLSRAWGTVVELVCVGFVVLVNFIIRTHRAAKLPAGQVPQSGAQADRDSRPGL